MKKAEKVLILLAVGSLVFKFSGSHEGSFFLSLAIISLAFFYLIFSFFLLKGESSSIAVRIISGVILFLLCLSTVTRFLYMPENETLMVFSLGMALIWLAVLKFRKVAFPAIEQRLLPFLIFGIALFFIPVRSMIAVQYKNDPVRAVLHADAYENPGDTVLQKNLMNHLLKKANE